MFWDRILRPVNIIWPFVVVADQVPIVEPEGVKVSRTE